MTNNKSNGARPNGAQNGTRANGAGKQSKLSIQRRQPPVAMGVAQRSMMPRVNGASGQAVVVIARKEFVGSAGNGATTGFALTPQSASTPGYDLNPGCFTMFPWLSNIAPNFERFRFRRLSFHFIPSQATTTAGRYYAAVDYDYDDNVAPNKLSLMGNRTAVEAPVWQETTLSCVAAELHRDMPTKYVSLNSKSNYIEPRTAFCGFLMIAYDTVVANNLIDIWADYEVELISPVNDFAAVQNTLTGYTPPAVADVTTVSGVSNLGLPTISNSGAPGPIKVVTPGTQGVPPLSVTVGGVMRAAHNAIDLYQAYAKGNLTMELIQSVTGVSPDVTFGTDTLTGALYGFDSNGTGLGLVPPAAVGAAIQGVEVPANIVVNGAQARSKWAIGLSDLYEALPTLRYLVPAFVSGNAIGPGTAGAGFRYEL